MKVGRTDGRKNGRMEGRKEGKKEGRKEGRKEGNLVHGLPRFEHDGLEVGHVRLLVREQVHRPLKWNIPV